MAFDCLQVDSSISRETNGLSGLVLLGFFLKFHLDCLEKVHSDDRGEFPEAQEAISFARIIAGLKDLTPDLIRTDFKDLKMLGISVLDYQPGADVDLNKFLARCIFAILNSVSEEVSKSEEYTNDLLLAKRWQIRLKDFNSTLIDLDSATKSNIFKYLEIRRDVKSLHEVYAAIRTFKNIFADNIAIIDTRLAFQALFQSTGEFLKSTQDAPNLSADVSKLLEDKGIPVKYLSDISDKLFNYELPTFINLLDVQDIAKLLQDLIAVSAVIKSTIIEIEKSYILGIIRTSAFPESPVIVDINIAANEGVEGVVAYINHIKQKGDYDNKALVDEIYRNALQIETSKISLRLETDDIELHVSTSQASNIKESISEYIENGKLKMYEKLRDQLKDRGILSLETAHEDVLRITKITYNLRNSKDPKLYKEFFKDFMKMEVLDKIFLEKGVFLREKLQRNFNETSCSIDRQDQEEFNDLLALKHIYDNILEGKITGDDVYTNLTYQYRMTESSSTLGGRIKYVIKILYKKEVQEEFKLLQKLKNSDAIIAQINNLYSALKRLGDDWVSIEFKKIRRNYLEHGDVFASNEDRIISDAKIINLKDTFVRWVHGGIFTNDNIAKAFMKFTLDDGNKIKNLLCQSRSSRCRTSANENCVTWEEIDKFNEGGAENRDPDSVMIDSDKFISAISHEFEINEKKFHNLIALASDSEVVGRYHGEVDLITSKHRFLNRLEKVRNVSEMVMHGMKAKELVRDLMRGDDKDVIMNLGFIGRIYGLAKLAEALNEVSYMMGRRVQLIKSLRLAEPVLSRVTSAFVVYDLYNQVKEYEKGKRNVLVPIFGDSIQLEVDVDGVEFGEGLGLVVFQRLSTAPGAIGVASVILVGTEIYANVRTLKTIDEKIHLTVFPLEYNESLFGKNLRNIETIDSAINFLKCNPHIRKYIIRYYANKRTDDVKLDQWENVEPRPANLDGIVLFCVIEGHWEYVSYEDAYYCEESIGIVVEYEKNRTGNSTLINFGNERLIHNEGNKVVIGGNRDDYFIFDRKGDVIDFQIDLSGSIDGSGGVNTIDVGGLPLRYDFIREGQYEVFANFRDGILTDSYKVDLKLNNINQFLGRKGGIDRVLVACDTNYIDGKGGANKDHPDSIIIPKDDACAYHTKVIVNPYTTVSNNANSGEFLYFVKGEKGTHSYIDLGLSWQSHTTIFFNYTLQDIAAIDKSKENITFSFVEEFYKIENKDKNSSFTLTISGNYKNIEATLIDSTKIVIGQNNVYALQNTEKPIESLVIDYSSVADRLKIYVILHSNNEVLTIGSIGNDVLSNDPSARISHLVGMNGENVYVVTAPESLTLADLPVAEVIVYNFDTDNMTDTIDLRQIKEQIKNDIGVEVNIEISRVDSDLLINLFLDNESKGEALKMRLKGFVENNSYQRIQIVMNSVFLIEKIHDNFELTPKPLVFSDYSKTIYVIDPNDVANGNKIVIKKEIGDYVFARDNDALLITSSLGSYASENNFYTVMLNDFYHKNNTGKMHTLQVEFNDKKISLNEERERIMSALNFRELRENIVVNSYRFLMSSVRQKRLFDAVDEDDIGKIEEFIGRCHNVNATDDHNRTLLYHAVKRGHLRIVRLLIDRGANVNELYGDGLPPLLRAAIDGNVEQTRILVIEGADVNVKDYFSYTPLHHAAIYGYLDIVKILVDKGADIIGKDFEDKTPLHHAALHGNVEIANFLIDGKAARNTLDEDGYAPIHLAAQNNHVAVVGLLIDKEVSVDERDKHNWTIVHWAAEKCHFDLFMFVIRKNAKINIKNNDGKAAFDLAVEKKCYKIIKYLYQAQLDLDKVLLNAIEKSDLDKLKASIIRGANVNVKDYFDKTALHRAVMFGYLDIVRILVDEGADVNVRDFLKKSPLEVAFMYGFMGIVRILVDKGADVNVKDYFKKTPLHRAVINDYLDIVRILVEKGADVNSKDVQGKTPLHHAASNGNVEIASYLIEQNAILNILDNDGYAPVHLAAQKNHVTFVRFLIDKGVSVDERDKYALTPLHWEGNLELTKLLVPGGSGTYSKDIFEIWKIPTGNFDRKNVMEFLLDNGMSINLTDDNDWTHLHWAAWMGDLNIVNYLISNNAYINIKNNEGKTPFDLAFDKQYYGIKNVLKQAQLNLNNELLIAVEKSNLNKLKETIIRGANVNAKNQDGFTSLHRAAINGSLVMATLLVDNGADVNVKGYFDERPLHRAAIIGNLEIARLLVSKGADVNVTDYFNNKPLIYASHRSDLVNFLKDQMVWKGSGVGPVRYIESLLTKSSFRNNKIKFTLP